MSGSVRSVAWVASLVLLVGACGGGSDGGTPSQPGSPPGPPPVNTVLIPGAATLALRVAGPPTGVDYDRLDVKGRAVLSGNLQVTFDGGFIPTRGQAYTLVNAAGGLTGRFDAVNTGGVPFSLTYTDTSLVLTIL